MAPAMSKARSRSPRRDLAAVSTGLLRALDVEKMQLRLDERTSKVLYFGDEDIWLEAKPHELSDNSANTIMYNT